MSTKPQMKHSYDGNYLIECSFFQAIIFSLNWLKWQYFDKILPGEHRVMYKTLKISNVVNWMHTAHLNAPYFCYMFYFCIFQHKMSHGVVCLLATRRQSSGLNGLNLITALFYISLSFCLTLSLSLSFASMLRFKQHSYRISCLVLGKCEIFKTFEMKRRSNFSWDYLHVSAMEANKFPNFAYIMKSVEYWAASTASLLRWCCGMNHWKIQSGCWIAAVDRTYEN